MVDKKCTQYPTDGVGSRDWLLALKGFAGAELIDGRHAESILLAIRQAGHVELGQAHEIAHYCPSARLQLLNNVAGDGGTAVVLFNTKLNQCHQWCAHIVVL